jgi:hypothetical protein
MSKTNNNSDYRFATSKQPQTIQEKFRKTKTMTTMVVATLVLMAIFSLQLVATSVAGSSSYATSNFGIPNIQASSPTSNVGATDSNGACVTNAPYNNDRSESWIAVDPTNPNHLVGMSKFFFDPEFYLFHIGTYVSTDGGSDWINSVVPGFDCQSAPTNTWTDTTDPNLAFDLQGNIYSTFLPFSFTYNSHEQQVYNVVPNDGIYVVKSTDGGNAWTIANQGQPLTLYTSSGLGETADKQWIAVDANPSSPFAGNIYVAWTVFDGFSSEIWFSMSSDHGAHFSTPVMLSTANTDGPFNTYVFLGTAPDGTLYISYMSFPSSTFPLSQVWILKSTDEGHTFSVPKLAVSFNVFPSLVLPNTTFRDGISDNFAVNPANGHLLLALEEYNGNGIDVYLTESTNGGNSWSTPISVNDPSTVNDGTDQFQPTVAASPGGTVAVAFYDRRLPCPKNDPNILAQDYGRTNFCINTSIQFYKDGQGGLARIGSNIRVTEATWDPQNAGTNTDGLPLPGGPTTTTSFIGDYFGLALNNRNAYVLFVSTCNLGQNQFNNQQQFLGIVPIPK